MRGMVEGAQPPLPCRVKALSAARPLRHGPEARATSPAA